MKRLAVLALGLVLVTVALPATTATEDDQTIRETNRAWLLDHNPDYDPHAIVELHTGEGVEQVTGAKALEMTLDRAGDTLLAGSAAPAGSGEDDLGYAVVGDIWIIGTGNVNCGEASTVTETPIYPSNMGPFNVYDGNLSYVKGAAADAWKGIEWVTYSDFSGSGPLHYGGNVDRFCFEGPGFEILFPFINGYTTTITSPPVILEGPIV